MSSKGRGKRRGTPRKAPPAKKANTQPEDLDQRLTDSDNSGMGEKGQIVDFENILRSNINLLTGPQDNPASQDNTTSVANQNILSNAFKLFQSAPGQDVEQMRCTGDEIFAHVPQSLRQQICRDEYINLALLLKGGMELKEFCSGGSFKLSAEGGLEMKTKVCKEKIQSVEKWTDAFLIYASIYLTKYPTKALEMMHYMFVIREAASRQRGFCWREYDEQFRVRRANSTSSWSVINNDLWWRCMQVRDSGASTSENVAQPRSYTCNDFNAGLCRWPSPCRYPHVCSSCGSSQHGAVACSQSNPRSQQFGNSMLFRGTLRHQRGRGPRVTNGRGRSFRSRPF